MPETRIDLLRHGECEGGEIFRGSTDVALTDLGWEAMQAQLERRQPVPWRRIISSPLKRCLAFSRANAEASGLPLVVEPGLREMHFGEWEGRTYAEIWESDPRLKLWGQDPERHRPPGGEHLADFAERVDAAFARVASSCAGEHLLLVTHGGVIRYLLTRAKGLKRGELRQMDVPYAHFASLVWREGRLSVVDGADG